jgi:hypothetical protein
MSSSRFDNAAGFDCRTWDAEALDRAFYLIEFDRERTACRPCADVNAGNPGSKASNVPNPASGTGLKPADALLSSAARWRQGGIDTYT